MRCLGRLRLLTRRVRRWGQPRALILLYHRVGDVPTDRHSLVVTSRHFQEHLDVLCARTRPMRLGELIKGMLDGRQDYTPTTIAAVREAGFASACLAPPGWSCEG
jgi:hypothetical protein